MAVKRFLYLVYFWLVFIPIFTAITILAVIVCVVGCLLGGKRIFSYWPGKIWSMITLFLAGCRVTVEGREHIEPGKTYVVMANHQGAFDIFSMYGYLQIPFRWVMKQGIRQIPLVGYACQVSGFIFVDETKPSSIVETMKQSVEVLRQRTSIFIFPEGARTETGRMSRFRKGGFLMADQLDVPILPVSIDGSYDVLRIGSLVPHPHRIRLTIHPELHVCDFGPKPRSYVDALSATRELIASVLPREQESAERQ